MHLPEPLRTVKVSLGQKLSTAVKRQLSISRLASASRMVLGNTDLIAQMLQDWRSLDVESVVRETVVSGQSETSEELAKSTDVTHHVIRGG